MRTKVITTVYIADISPLLDSQVYDRLRNLVSEDRRAKADAMKFAKGRAQSLGAGLLLHEACRDVAAAGMDGSGAAAGAVSGGPATGMAGFECADEHIAFGEYEKPDFDQKWLADKGFGEMHFSLSHSGERVMCGISTAQVGCDVEIVKDRDMKIARRFFCEEEYADIIAQPDNAKADRFFRYWTLKESVIKCEGRGLGMPLDSFRILLTEEGPKLETSAPAADVAMAYGGEYTLKEFALGDGYKYSCCVNLEAGEVEKKCVDIIGLK
ncbi:MAG: 4'-phosphopantetheinyl transferase superfamily protein [Clostridia bacterium]|nr:4'-phosphopantetheinyl transferase superfamily protein [Clostridia bacterium]